MVGEASPALDADIAVIGAGVVGLAVAERLAAGGVAGGTRRSVVVVERHEAYGRETSAHNTGIVHAGMFYETGSLKHRLCLEGNALLHEWADAHTVPLRRCGKLIVAVEPGDLDGLERVWERGVTNEVPGMRHLTPQEARALEPRVRMAAAVWSGASSVVDQAAYARSLESACRDRGVLFAYQHSVVSAGREGGGFVLGLRDVDGHTSTLRVGAVVNAAGHGAPAIASMLGFPLDGDERTPILRQRVNRGRYYDFADPEWARSVSRPVYPVPPGSSDVQRHQARAGGLGVHISIDVDGVAHLGPDTAWMPDASPEGGPMDYRSVDEGREAFLAAGRWLLGDDLRAEDLVPGQVGYRPKLVTVGDTPADFLIFRAGDYVHLGGIESPGLTASLAIGRYVEVLLT
ncbi:MAG: NAD(P)/FAD-dependent oxidoreductase [Dehalococcoidia bacterium]|nr:NAD(P)/FAD-dependent oxidoreductase [Dehalococcoidia bacterium]